MHPNLGSTYKSLSSDFLGTIEENPEISPLVLATNIISSIEAIASSNTYKLFSEKEGDHSSQASSE